MILLKYILFFLIPLCTQAEDWNIIAIRDLYYKAPVSKEDSEKFKTALNSITTPNACIKGYIAASYMIEAKHLYNPAFKLSAFNNGKNMLENVIKTAPENVELRFLRIGIQVNTPSLLGYNEQIEIDKKHILLNYKLLTDVDLKKRIKDFMLASGLCTDEEKNIFN